MPIERPAFVLLPENVPVLRLWGAVQTQWAHGPLGPTGFQWHSLRLHPDVRAIPAADREPLLQGLAVMERAWLAQRHLMQAAEARGKGLGA
ncbi:DUF1799 domain-containing protein [Pelomonas sp. Root1444]|uniref:DUF1799 domain-containing protein n=1 Tax=Pelomonas sp. Root1444 TaxID=1736464 RepID=UPI0007037C81|nr:DUF1799 domain-containing protein [Pelomonas sp. Root1444]KQY83650.1 hypothetical protein ASD35_24305 [Pelomonas sp. Root1444]